MKLLLLLLSSLRKQMNQLEKQQKNKRRFYIKAPKCQASELSNVPFKSKMSTFLLVEQCKYYCSLYSFSKKSFADPHRNIISSHCIRTRIKQFSISYVFTYYALLNVQRFSERI